MPPIPVDFAWLPSSARRVTSVLQIIAIRTGNQHDLNANALELKGSERDGVIPISMQYGEISARLKESRDWGKNVTDGNKCALAVGAALRLKPYPHHRTFRGAALGQSGAAIDALS